MADLAPLPEPADWPDVLPDWACLSPAAQHGLMVRKRQLGRFGNNEADLDFVVRLLRPVRSASRG